MFQYRKVRVRLPSIMLVLALAASCGGSGGSSRGGSVPFRVDAVTPLDGAMNTSIRTTIEVRFSRALDPSTLQNGVTFFLTEASTPSLALPGQFLMDASGRGLTFTPDSPLLFATTYTVQVTGGLADTLARPIDLAANLVPIPSIFDSQMAPDTIPPIFGGATGAMALTDTSIEVSWSPASDDIDQPSAIVYNVYVSAAAGAQDFNFPNAVSPPGATSQTIGGLLPSTLVFFVVRAEDSSGNEEGNLVEVSATTMATPDTTPPVFGGVTSASVVSPTEVRLMWNAASDDRSPPSQIVYNIYLATASGGQNFAAPSATTAPGATSETVTGLSPDTDHFFVVRAVDTSGNEEANTVEIQGRTLVSFMAQAEPIFTGNCALSGCHAGPFPQQGMNLSSFATIDSTAINVLANETAASTMLFRIQPFDSAASYLVHKIDGTQLSVGGSGAQMPFGAPPLSQEDRDIVRMWIDQGALNN